MGYVVTNETSTLGNINLNPTTETEEVLQNVAMILSTPKFSTPLMRDFGLPMQFLDRRTEAAKSVMIGEVYDAVEKYEPRATIERIEVKESDSSGRVITAVEVSVNV